MKIILLLTAFLSFSAAANEMAMRRTIVYIDELNQNGMMSFVGCDPNDPNAPAYCKDLYGYICSVKKTNNGLAALDRDLNGRYWRNLPNGASHRQFNDMARTTHQISEDSVFNVTQVMRDDIRNALTDTKTALKQFITSTPLISSENRTRMAAAVDNVNLRYGREYIDRIVNHAKAQNPNIPEDQIRTQAYQMYMGACGVNGLEVNAFYEGGSIVLCPGLMISMKDYGADKTQMLAALRFTLGHEIGHAIDAAEFPEVYSNMGSCYASVSGNSSVWQGETAGEISADYWGAIALTSNHVRDNKLNLSNTDNNARIVALSVDGFCTEAPTAASPHPEGSFRVNQSIGRHPYIARALGCDSISSSTPYCGLQGRYVP